MGVLPAFRRKQKNSRVKGKLDNLQKKNKDDESDHVAKYYFKELPTYYVYKKCVKSVNKLYWRVKTKDALYYYTDSDNEKETLGNILASTKLIEVREQVLDHFFEYILGSHLLGEDEELLRLLSAGQIVTIPGSTATLKSQDWFEKETENCQEQNK